MKSKVAAVIFSFMTINANADVDVKTLMNDESFTNQIDFDQISGQYSGKCSVTLRKHINSTVQESTYNTKEALYVGKFINAKNETVQLAFSTEHTHGDINFPKKILYLLNGSAAAKSLVQKIINEGLTGTDNNIGKLASDPNFRIIYSSKILRNTLEIYTTQIPTCSEDGRKFCNPTALRGCRYQLSNDGEVFFNNCFRENDITRFKKLPDNRLISHRTVDQLGEPDNNFSFVLPEISSFCSWDKL
jgi:hypothetical protein